MTVVRAACPGTTQMDASETGQPKAAHSLAWDRPELTQALVLTSCSTSKDSPYCGEAGKWKNLLGFQNKSPFRQI